MKPLKYIPQYTYDDYRQWQGDWELIDGLPYAMSPSPLWNHQRIAGQVFNAIETVINKNGKGCGSCKAVYELDWVINAVTVVRPDIAVICEPIHDFIRSAPRIVVELLSPSTAMKDRIIKMDIYHSERVQYYIIIDPDKRTTQTFAWRESGYLEENSLQHFELKDDCALQLDLSTVVQLADL